MASSSNSMGNTFRARVQKSFGSLIIIIIIIAKPSVVSHRRRGWECDKVGNVIKQNLYLEIFCGAILEIKKCNNRRQKNSTCLISYRR
ncbi:hypothetical protein CsSME_00033289 [Camellia sinensis var. sinensis]